MKKKIYILGVGILSTFFILVPILDIKVDAVTCIDVNAVFVRGSSQNLSNGKDPIDNLIDWHLENNSIIFNRGDDFQSTEKESAQYFKGIGSRIIEDFPKLTMQFVSLHDFAGKYNANGYKAVPAFGSLETVFLSKNAVDAKFGNYQIVGDVTGDAYNQSVKDGAEELAGYLEDQMVRCPSQYISVGGFSQGAQVVGEAMKLMHGHGKDNLLSRLGHVDLYGDPKFNGFELETSRLNPLQKHTTYPWTRGSPTQNHVGSLGPRMPYVPDILTAKTTSWCDFNDVVCGGYAGIGADIKAHGSVYGVAGGWIEKSSNETYVDMKTRLGLLAGITDKSANSPFAFWSDIKKPSKLDVMFVMDNTSDESLVLIPDEQYLVKDFLHLSDPYSKETHYSSIRAGVVTYTEMTRFDDSYIYDVRTPVQLTPDIYSDNSYFKSEWGREHFQTRSHDGGDLQDSPFSALNAALSQQWQSDARKVIVVVSDSWGKDPEPTTGITMKQITAKAKAKHVEILPLFTSQYFRSNSALAQRIPEANLFYQTLAKQTKGHAVEMTGAFSEFYVYDVILGHIFAPDVQITIGKVYNDPKTGKAAKTEIGTDKPVFKTGKKIVLSAEKSTSAKSKIKKYKWDTNGDGKTDEESELPDINFTPTPGDTTVCVEAIDINDQSTSDCQDISTGDGSQVTHEEPALLASPVFTDDRSGTSLIVNWSPVDGDIVFTNPLTGAIIAIVEGRKGTFTFTNVPTAQFTITAQLLKGNDASLPVTIEVDAAPVIPGNTGTTITPGTGAIIVPSGGVTPETGGLGLAGSAEGSGTGSHNNDVQQILGASVQSVNLLSDAKTLVIAPGGNVLAANTQNVKPRAKVKVQFGFIREFLQKAGVGFGNFIIVFGSLLGIIFNSFSILLILILLLLLLLEIMTRDREDKKYRYNQPKRLQTRSAAAL